MKKIFIALMLSATSVVTWADVTYNFGTGSTWTVKCPGNSLKKVTGVVINVAEPGDLAALRSANLIYDTNGNPVDHNNKPEEKYNLNQQVYQKDVVVSGTLSEADMNCIYADGKQQWTFCTAKTLDLSGVNTTATSIFDNIKSGWESLAWCHGNSKTAGLVIPSSGNTGGSASTDPSEPSNPTSIYELPNQGNAAKHITLHDSFNKHDYCEIHTCGKNCKDDLSWILEHANITPNVRFDRVVINLDNKKHKVTDALDKINTFALDLTGVTSLDTTTTTWSSIKNQYVGNVILPVSMGDMKIDVVKKNFNLDKLYNVIISQYCVDCQETNINAYVNKPGFFATGLQYVSLLKPVFTIYEPQWYNQNVENHNGGGYKYNAGSIRNLKLSGYVFARDLKSTSTQNVDADGHLIPSNFSRNGISFNTGVCTCELAPSYKEIGKTVFYCDGHEAAPSTYMNTLTGAKITSFDLTYAEFGEMKDGVFHYYPADMTLSELQDFAVSNGSVAHLSLPTSPTQYIIPEGFVHDSWYLHELCIPHNYTEIHRFAFLGTKLDTLGVADNGAYILGQGGIHNFSTTAAKDDELKGIKKGQVIDYGKKSLTLASTMKYVGRGAFSGYGGAALLEDVYCLAEKAPICEFYAFDQKTCVGQDSHEQGHLIKKGNYVNPSNGMAMLHFPNTTNRIEMMNYSDLTRKYRLYDETGHYDNLGNILVWPTQAQYNRSFNQAMAGVTWEAWVGYDKGQEDNPEAAYSTGWVAGGGDNNATHEILFTKAAEQDGYTEAFVKACDNKNPHDNFDGSWAKGSQLYNDYMTNWDAELIKRSKAEEQTDRPLTYDFVHYGGWHQFTIAELYDFMLDNPDPDVPKPDYYNFGKYNKNIWYAVCFPFNLTKSQLQKALGDPENNKYPYVSTLAGVNRDPKKLKISVHMSKNLLNYKIQYDKNCPNTVKCDKSTGYAAQYVAANYGDDDIVIEANKPYFILPALPDEEIKKAVRDGSEYNRKSEISVIKQVEGEPEKVMFPVATHVHAVNGSFSAYINGEDEEVKDTTYAYNYYFVGNYIPQEMPENAYYLAEYQKSNGDWWSSFYYNNPKKVGKMWNDNDAIVIAIIEDNASGHSRSKGEFSAEERFYSGKTTQNYIWNINSHNDEIFFYGTGNEVYAKSSFGIQLENNYTTSIVLPDDFETPESDKVYNLNGQFVGTDSDRMAKGIYIVGGKKVVK